MQKMWNKWVAQWGFMRKKTRRGRGAEAIQEKVVLDRGERDKARRGILLCAPLRLKGPRGKVQRPSGQWYDVHADMFRREGSRRGQQRGPSAGHAPRRRGRYCGRSWE